MTIAQRASYTLRFTVCHWCADGEHPIPGARGTVGDCLVPFPTHEGNTP